MQPHEYVILEIARERERQKVIEGWTPDHDDAHDNGEIATAAACYALGVQGVGSITDGIVRLWPWSPEWWKPRDHRRNCVRAAALIVAEIERLDRAEARRRSA